MSTKVESTAPVVAERAMYFEYLGKAGGHCSLGAKYEPPVIPETTKVLGEEELGDLLDWEETEDKITLTFASGNPVIEGLQPGDVIVGGVTAQTPGGLLLKVNKVTRDGGHVILETVGAAIEEAVESGRLLATIPLSADQVASTTILDDSVSFQPAAEEPSFRPAAETTLDFTYDFDGTLLEKDGFTVTLDGEVTLGITMAVEMEIKRFSLKKFRFSTTLFENVEVSLTAAYDILDIQKEKELVYHEFKDITFTVAGVPVILTPYVNLHVGIDGNVSAGVTCGATQSGSITTGVSYDNGVWSTVKDKSFTFDWIYPQPKAGAEFKAYAGPQVGLKFYHIAGPYVNLEPYVRLTVDLINPPPLGGLRGHRAGPGHPGPGQDQDLDQDLPGQEVRRPPEMGDAPGQRRGHQVHLPGNGPGGDGGDHKGLRVRRQPGKRFLREVRVQEGRGIHLLVRHGDQVQGAPDVSGTVEVTVTHIFHEWGPVTIKVTSEGMGFAVTGGGGGGGGAWETQLSGVPTLFGVDALDASHVWAVGAGGTIRFYNGSSWTSQASGTTEHLFDVSAADATHVWAVGDNGIVLFYNGSSWSTATVYATRLNGVYAADANHVWAVGRDGGIFHWNGRRWGDQLSGTTEDLYSVMGTGANDVWAVGANGTVLRWNGSSWSRVTGVTSDSVGDVWAKDGNNVWLLSPTTLYYYNGSSWASVPSGWAEGLVSVAGLASNRVWTGRWYGVIHFWNGTDWTPQTVAGSDVDIYDIEILDATNIWAVGGSGGGNTGIIAFNAGT